MKSIVGSLRRALGGLMGTQTPKESHHVDVPKTSEIPLSSQESAKKASSSPTDFPKTAQQKAPSHEYGMNGFTDVRYNQNADKAIEFISDLCDGLAEKFPVDIKEVNLDGGVLEIDTSRGKFILNKQAPSKQIWLSSPISGPHHYDMLTFPKLKEVMWMSKKDDQDLYSRLEHEFSRIAKTPIAFDV